MNMHTKKTCILECISIFKGTTKVTSHSNFIGVYIKVSFYIRLAYNSVSLMLNSDMKQIDRLLLTNRHFFKCIR